MNFAIKCFAIIVPLSGCGAMERLFTNITGELSYKCSKTGVEYVQSDSGLAPLYEVNGSLKTCSRVR